MAEVCEGLTGADVTQLATAIGYDPRIGRRFLAPGLGFGGGCLPKDIRAFIARLASSASTRRCRSSARSTRSICGGEPAPCRTGLDLFCTTAGSCCTGNGEKCPERPGPGHLNGCWRRGRGESLQGVGGSGVPGLGRPVYGVDGVADDRHAHPVPGVAQARQRGPGLGGRGRRTGVMPDTVNPFSPPKVISSPPTYAAPMSLLATAGAAAGVHWPAGSKRCTALRSAAGLERAPPMAYT